MSFLRLAKGSLRYSGPEQRRVVARQGGSGRLDWRGAELRGVTFFYRWLNERPEQERMQTRAGVCVCVCVPGKVEDINSISVSCLLRSLFIICSSKFQTC